MPDHTSIGKNVGREGREDNEMPGKKALRRYENIAGGSEQLRGLHGFRYGWGIFARCFRRLEAKHADDKADGERQIDGEHDDVQIKERVGSSETPEGALGVGIVIGIVIHVSSFRLFDGERAEATGKRNQHRKGRSEIPGDPGISPAEASVTKSAESPIFFLNVLFSAYYVPEWSVYSLIVSYIAHNVKGKFL